MLMPMADFAWDPTTYLQLMSAEVPDYPLLQSELVRATEVRTADRTHADGDDRHDAAVTPRDHGPVTRILDLGIGSGLTAALVLDAHPDAELVGLDASSDMLDAAHATLDPTRTRLVVGRLEDDLPDGPFDLVISSLAIHHLDGPGKADLFHRIRAVLSPSGRFVLADLVVPADPEDVVTPIDGVEDTPSPLADQLRWLEEAGFVPTVSWSHRDLAVVTALVMPEESCALQTARPRDVMELAGSIPYDGPALSIEEMDEAVAGGVIEGNA
jgi:tRNA (cmo5U34)-methyltransferase